MYEKTENMKIKNVKGSSKVSPNPPSGYKSWLEYWEVNSRNKLNSFQYYSCPACGRSFLRMNFDGCHVQKVDSDDKKWYIIPLCDSCNHTKGEPDVDASLLIDVPSNLKVTYSE